jgi:hypothetical protein
MSAWILSACAIVLFFSFGGVIEMSLMMKLCTLVVVTAVVSGGTIERAHADIVIDSIQRSVDAHANLGGVIGTPGSNSSTATGGYNESVSSAVAGAPGLISASASQNSTTPTPGGAAITGSGQSSTSLSPNGEPAFDELADSLFDATFHVDVSGQYNFQASVEWFGTENPLFGFSFARLDDSTNNLTLASAFADDNSFAPDTELKLLTLATGISYRLVAETRVYGADLDNTPLEADSNWSFSVAAVGVPESSSLAMLAVATLVSALGVWARGIRRSPSSSITLDLRTLSL